MLRTALPAVLHVQPGQPGGIGVFRALELILDRMNDDAPGSQAVVSHAAVILLTESLRAGLGRDCPPAGLLAAVLDENIGPVLGLVFGCPGRGWTLEQLADEAGLSRTLFHARFVELVGAPPMQFVRECRMHRASSMLRESDTPVKSVAKAVGYGSEGAFCTAFKRWSGLTPGRYRSNMEEGKRAAPPRE